MKKLIMSLCLVLSAASTAAPYGVINKDSKIEFGIQKFAIGKIVEGQFKTFTGDADIENGVLNSLTGNVIVSSIDTGNSKRDDHLKAGDFFAANSYSAIKFKTQGSIIFKEGQEKKVNALLNIKGIEKPIKIKLKIIAGKKEGRYIIIGKTSINRYDFGVTWNKRQDKTEEGILETITNFTKGLGDKYVLDKNVNIRFRLEVLQKKIVVN